MRRPPPRVVRMLTLIGVALVLFALVDMFMTVFMIGGGAGPQSAFVADRAWRLGLRLHDAASERSHSLMRAAGPLIVLLVLLCWVLELVVGWALVFVSHGFGASDPPDFGDRVLFAVRAVIGRSGNEPALGVAGDGWEIVYALAGATGVLIVSVGLAYVLPILASVAHKRSIAATIHTLGDTVDEMRALGRTPGGSSFELHLVGLIGEISLTAERHRSYPVLHYFHSRDPHAALAPAIAKIALLLGGPLGGVDKVDPTVRLPLQRAIANLLAALSSMGLSRYARDTRHVDQGALERIELDPSARDGDGADAPSIGWFEAYVRFDGWEWEAVPEGDSSRTSGSR